MIELDIGKRWEQGLPHHPKSIAMYEAIADMDTKHGGDFFCWKRGGDGDNGEHLMYLMDIHFEREDAKPGSFSYWPGYDQIKLEL